MEAGGHDQAAARRTSRSSCFARLHTRHRRPLDYAHRRGPLLRPLRQQASSSTTTTATSTRPAIHFASSPPRLDTSISSSPIELGFHANANQLRAPKEASSTVRSAPATVVDPLNLDVPVLSQRSDSGGSSVFSTPQSTPIADFYRGRTTSLFVPDSGDELAPPQRARSASQVSDTPSIDFDVAETQDDWTRSVLLAAEAGGSEAP